MSDLLSHHLNQIELSRRWRISPRTLERWRWLGEGPKRMLIYRTAEPFRGIKHHPLEVLCLGQQFLPKQAITINHLP